MFEKAKRDEKFAITATVTATADENLDVSLQSSASGMKTVSLAETLKDLRLDDLDEMARELLSDAKRRFKDARRKATEAFGNEALDTSDRILAMVIRVMATVLEKVDNSVNSLAACRVCLGELHALPAVQRSFNVALTAGLKSWFNKDERKKIITAVCQVNYAIYEVRLMVDSSIKEGVFSLCGLILTPERKLSSLCETEEYVVFLAHKISTTNFKHRHLDRKVLRNTSLKV